MAQSTVGIRIAVDAGQAQAQVSAFADTVDRLNEKLAEATDAGDWTGAANITATINNLAMAQGNMARVPNNGQGGGSGNNNNEQSSLGDRIVQAANQISNSMIQLGNGDIGGAAISAASGVGSGLRGVGKEIRRADPDSGLGKAMGVAGVGLEVIGAAAKVIHSWAEAYKDALPHMKAYNAIFSPASREEIRKTLAKEQKIDEQFVKDSDITERQININTEREKHNYTYAASKNFATNLTATELLDAALKESSYSNIASEDRDVIGKDGKTYTIKGAISTAIESAQFAYANNADLDLVQDVRGRARKFGDRENAADAVYTAMKATGGNTGQINEFLQAMQKVMEDGISNGFLKSSRDAAENLTMFARLSNNNPFWTGEQGAKRMISMGNAISSATALGDTKDAIMFSAAQDALENMNDADKAKYVGSGKDWNGTYIDTQLMLERGVTPEFMKSYFDKVDNLYGNNHSGKIEELKRDFNLNYTGATQLYDMSKNKGEISKEDLDAVLSNKDYENNETRMREALENISKSKIFAGEKVFDVEMTGLDLIADTTQKIYFEMLKKNGETVFDNTGLFNENDNVDKGVKQDLFKQYGKLSNREANEVNRAMSFLASLSDTDKNIIDKSNVLNTDDVRDIPLFAKVVKEGMANGKSIEDIINEEIKAQDDRYNLRNAVYGKNADAKSNINPEYYARTNGQTRERIEALVKNYALTHEKVGDKWVVSAEQGHDDTITAGELMAVFTELIKNMGNDIGKGVAKFLETGNINIQAEEEKK